MCQNSSDKMCQNSSEGVHRDQKLQSLNVFQANFLSRKNDSEKETEYIQSVIKADFAEAGDDDVFRKVKADLKDRNISGEEIRKKMDELNEKAKSEFK